MIIDKRYVYPCVCSSVCPVTHSFVERACRCQVRVAVLSHEVPPSLHIGAQNMSSINVDDGLLPWIQHWRVKRCAHGVASALIYAAEATLFFITAVSWRLHLSHFPPWHRVSGKIHLPPQNYHLLFQQLHRTLVPGAEPSHSRRS